MVFPGNICLLCLYAYLATMHFLWASPKMLCRDQELRIGLTFFGGGFRSKGNSLGGATPHFQRKCLL